jgi:hypothetical protein
MVAADRYYERIFWSQFSPFLPKQYLTFPSADCRPQYLLQPDPALRYCQTMTRIRILATHSGIRVDVACGFSRNLGRLNFDNSFSARTAYWPALRELAAESIHV